MNFALLDGLPFQTDPTEIRWDFKMKSADGLYLGGKVIQILGTELGDLTVTGTFGRGPASELGENWRDQQRFNDRIKEIAKAAAERGGLGYNADPKPLRFQYKPRGWDFNVFIKSLTPNTRHHNEEIAPKWTLTMLIDEDDAAELKGQVVDMYLQRLMRDVGWKQTEYNGPQVATYTVDGQSFGEYLEGQAQAAFDAGVGGLVGPPIPVTGPRIPGGG